MKKTILFLITVLFASCTAPEDWPEEEKRNYTVRLSNHIGSDYYDCDSIKYITQNRIQLFNIEDTTYFVDITIPQGVVLRIYPNK